VTARRATERSIVEPKVLWLNPATLDEVIKILASEADELAHFVIADSLFEHEPAKEGRGCP
jgi:hypothetical protein